MLNKKNIIFDFDGVIAETEHGRYELLATLLTNHGVNLKENYAVQDIAGIPTDIFLKTNFPALTNEKIVEIVKERRNLFFKDLGKYCSVYPGASETIKDLKKQGYSVILATTNDSVVGEKLLEFIGIENEFTHKLYRNDIQNIETQKKDYSMLVKKLGVRPNNSVIIEDSYIGISSAKSNSFFCIAFNRYGDKSIENLADITISDFRELRSVFKLT